jgi:hypothetical protein
MTNPDYGAKSFIIGGWQWWRNSETMWVTEFGWYVFLTDGGWWLCGNGFERWLCLRQQGIKRALLAATRETRADGVKVLNTPSVGSRNI